LKFITKKHNDLNVTVAEVKQAYFYAFCAETGTVHFELNFSIRNTQQQV